MKRLPLDSLHDGKDSVVVHIAPSLVNPGQWAMAIPIQASLINGEIMTVQNQLLLSVCCLECWDLQETLRNLSLEKIS